jgi:hypothetical protein
VPVGKSAGDSNVFDALQLNVVVHSYERDDGDGVTRYWHVGRGRYPRIHRHALPGTVPFQHLIQLHRAKCNSIARPPARPFQRLVHTPLFHPCTCLVVCGRRVRVFVCTFVYLSFSPRTTKTTPPPLPSLYIHIYI